MKFQIKTFTRKEITIHYLEGGEGETLLFLHGWGIRADTYRKTLQLLAKNFHVIAPDIPGFGSSSRPPTEWNFEKYGEFFAGFMKERGLKNVILMGHSLGGGIAVYIAAKCTLVNHLVLADAACMPIEYNRLKIYHIFMRHLFSEFGNLNNLRITFRALKHFAQNLKNIVYWLPFSYKIVHRDFAVHTSIFAAISCPTLILWGEKDLVYTKKIAYRLQRELPHATLKFIPGTHDWILFKPELLKEYIDAF